MIAMVLLLVFCMLSVSESATQTSPRYSTACDAPGQGTNTMNDTFIATIDNQLPPPTVSAFSDESLDLSTPLHVAAYRGRSDAIQWLIEEGHDINARNYLGATPLHMAASSEDGEIAMSLLVLNGANVNATNASGSTPLHVCARFGRAHGAAILLTQGNANIHAVTAELDTPLHLARPNSSTANLLLGYGADPTFRNARGRVAWTGPESSR